MTGAFEIELNLGLDLFEVFARDDGLQVLWLDI
jgi:hypothetical protein